MAYLCLLVVWAVTLWFLSAGNPAPKNGPEIPHLDKLAHFLYFSAGGVLLAACGLLLMPVLRQQRWRLFWCVTALVAVIGRLDEYHQTFTPGRSGNDMGDWAADILGGGAGACFVLFLVWPGLQHVGAMSQKKSGKSQFVANSLD